MPLIHELSFNIYIRLRIHTCKYIFFLFWGVFHSLLLDDVGIFLAYKSLRGRQFDLSVINRETSPSFGLVLFCCLFFYTLWCMHTLCQDLLPIIIFKNLVWFIAGLSSSFFLLIDGSRLQGLVANNAWFFRLWLIQVKVVGIIFNIIVAFRPIFFFFCCWLVCRMVVESLICSGGELFSLFFAGLCDESDSKSIR